MQFGIEQHEPGGKTAGAGLDSGDRHTPDRLRAQIDEQGRGRRIAVLDEHRVGADQRMAVRRRRPTHLPLKGRNALIMPLGCGDRVAA